ncbi:Cytokinesis protein sepH [Mycena kentingensis (nom. inval.)]|nr:Cytokinesis protein sepH [Mycena kentingensis (nom. inval.)]
MSTPHRPPSRSSTTPNPTPKSLNDYQLGDSLGKGAFGQVYRALNWATGETVAVKEIQLTNIPKGELGEIMSEIDLLKNLNHANIVKYKGFVKTREYLYIILEFCENGSLHNILKRFGKFPENLVAVYISQVLEGLMYLHDQGVIHRDIKGANLLTNKDGTVKLADFGVAANTTSVNDGAVVGSPYWMAPEVIEQSGATTASDIWSVGCVVIELLEGHPPYHTLDPMPALFRIVQDDCPPIPEGASPIVKDFLYHCFQKDANLRISAKKLLRHPWMVQARRQLTDGKEPEEHKPSSSRPQGQNSTQRRPLSNYNYDEAVLKVQEWNEALKSPSRLSKHPNRRQPSPTREVASSPSTSAAPWRTVAKPATIPPLSFSLQPPEEQTDNWDDDFEEGISLTKLQALEKAAEENITTTSDENAKTIRPNKSPAPKPPVPLAKAPSEEKIMEDYSDLVGGDEDGILESKVKDFKMKNSLRKGLFHPDDIKTFGLSNGHIPTPPLSAPSFTGLFNRSTSEPKPAGPVLSPLVGVPTMSGPSSAILAGAAQTQTPVASTKTPSPIPSIRKLSHSRSTSFTAGTVGIGGSMGRAEARRMLNEKEFGKYQEEEDEDYEDVFGKVNGAGAGEQSGALQLTTRLSNRSWLGDNSDEEDPFAEIDEGFAEDDLEANLQRDKYARMCNMVNGLLDQLTPAAPDFQLRDACDQLLNVITETPEMQGQLVSSHGMLAILEVLESKCSRDVSVKLLQMINLLVNSNLGFLESFCLIGGIPVMMGFTSKKFPPECRLEASNFIRLLCHTSVMTLQMFISCRGLKVLVDLIDEDYTEQTDLVVDALNGIGSVFELQSPTTKNDFCRMFIREGLLDPLSAALINVISTGGPAATEIKMKIIQILLVFSQVSQSDIHVRNALGTRKVVRRLLRSCELLEPECLVQMLKAVKHLSMNATLLEVLQNANAIEILVKILEEQSSGPHSTEMSNHIFQTCYNLCRLNKSRQEEAAQAGIIPCLQRVIETKSPLKQFALPILCDLTSAGKSCRTLLWQHDGLGMYLKLLEDPYFQVSALESILSWLQDETARVEDELTKPPSVAALLSCFVGAKANSFENLLDPFLKIARLSSSVTIAIARSPTFIKRIIERLAPAGTTGPSKEKAVVRLNLLRILRTVCEVHPNRAMLVERYGLLGIVEGLSRGGGDGAVLVRELAREIVPVLKPGLKPAVATSASALRPNSNPIPRSNGSSASSDSPRAGLAPKRLRRTASETVGPSFGSTARAAASSGEAKNGKTKPPPRQKLGDIAWGR